MTSAPKLAATLFSLTDDPERRTKRSEWTDHYYPKSQVIVQAKYSATKIIRFFLCLLLLSELK